jgi:prophage maintenance system killer protein
MLVFLGLNGVRMDADDDALTDLVVGVADGRVSKAEAAVFVKRHTRPR